MTLSLVRIAACLLAAGVMASAQSNRPAPLASPIVHADRSITFSVRAPNAKKVELSAQFLRPDWLGVGKTDFLHQQAVEFDDYLKGKNIVHRSPVTEGGHTWMNARHYLAEMLPLLFK